MLTLNIKQRDASKKAKTLRVEGTIPAVMYGRKEPSAAIALDRKEFEKVWREAGESTVLSLEGVGEPKEALVHEVAFDPVTDSVQHVDFYVTEKGVAVKTHVALSFTGEADAPAIKSLGGTLMKVMHEVEVEALPKDLPHEIVVDVSVLANFDDKILVSDIKVPAGVVIVAEPEEMVAAVAEPKEEEIEEAPAAIDMEAIEEVDQKGKKEDEEAAPESEEKKEE